MKKVVVFLATQRKKATYGVAQQFEKSLKGLMDAEFEYLFLPDYRLEYCRGCRQCFDRGEEHCPLKDDRDLLLAKMANADGVVFAVPTYSFQVPARMKNLLDRMAYLCHRPRFQGKTFTAIVTQGFWGGPDTRKYLEGTAETLGFEIAKGASVTALVPTTESQERQIAKAMDEVARRFHAGLSRQAPPAPSLFRLMIFRVSRMRVRLLLDDTAADYRHYKAKGWFDSAYYSDAVLNPLQRLAGNVFDRYGAYVSTHR